MEGDGTSFLSQEPDWEPFLPTLDPAAQGEDFRVVDLLKFAGVTATGTTTTTSDI